MDYSTAIANFNANITELVNQVDAEARADELGQLATAVLAGNLITPYTNLHRMPKADKETLFGWCQPGNVGNIGGGSSKPHGSFDFIPAVGNGDALFTCQAIGWDNFYLYMLLGSGPRLGTTLCSRLTMLHKFAASLDPIQAIEWQSQITYQGLTHNMAFQFEVPRKEVNIYDKASEAWQPTKGIPFPDFSNPVTVISEFALDPSSTTHVAITINGVRYPIGITKAAPNQKLGDKYTTGIQIDPKQNASCALKISNAQVITL